MPVLYFDSGELDPKGAAGWIANIGLPSFLLGHIFIIIALASEHARSKKLARSSLITVRSGVVLRIVLVIIFRTILGGR